MKLFNKFFGRKTGENKTSDLSQISNVKKLMQKYDFLVSTVSENGMYKYFEWKNTQIIFSLTHDRGYYNCDVSNVNKDFKFDLIALLKFLKNNPTFYNKELKSANLSRTLVPNEYAKLLVRNYHLVASFASSYTQDALEKYKRFEIDYDGI